MLRSLGDTHTIANFVMIVQGWMAFPQSGLRPGRRSTQAALALGRAIDAKGEPRLSMRSW